MRRGHADDWFADIVPGILLLLLGFALFSFASRDIQTSSLDTLAFQDSFDRTLLTFLSSPVQPLTVVDDVDLSPQYAALANKHYTYGDLLFLASVDQQRASLYYGLFSYHLRQNVFTLSSPLFKTPTVWELSTSSAQPLVVNSLEGQSVLPSSTSIPVFPSTVVALFFPLSKESVPLSLSSHYGEVSYFAP